MWNINNTIQRDIGEKSINEITDTFFRMDPHQNIVESYPPPFLIESRLGNGNTNVLFQNVVTYSYHFRGNINGVKTNFKQCLEEFTPS